MYQHPIATAAGITKHLQINSGEEQNMLNELHQQLSNSLIDDNLIALKGVSFAHERTDFFAAKEKSTTASNADAKNISASEEKPTHRIFIRDTPVRNTQIKTSV